jgi:signal transduction histidine kinase
MPKCTLSQMINNKPLVFNRSIDEMSLLGKMLLENKIEMLKQQLSSNMIFLNMVVHDMRNPSSSILFAVE